MIYIACPSKYATGGTELLHQLFFELSKKTREVMIFYYDHIGIDNPTADRFLKYNPNWVIEIVDSMENILIVPEVKGGIELLKGYSSIKKAIWWLSVDNYLLSNGIGLTNHLYNENGVTHLIKSTLRRLLKAIQYSEDKSLVDFNDKTIIHLYQSEYAKRFLQSNGVEKTYPLSDYINEDLIPDEVNVMRENILLYNPAKGFKVTKKVLKHIETLIVIPIIGLNLVELKELYAKSKVYIDFGYHPGKDRIPREAAVNGTIVITNIKGSAGNDFDVPISNEYKFDTSVVSTKKVAQFIEKFSSEYFNRISDFEYYRKQILLEKEKFIGEVNIIFTLELRQYSIAEALINV